MAEKERDAFRGGVAFGWPAASLALLAISLSLCAVFAAGCAAPGEPTERKSAAPQAVSDLTVHQQGDEAELAFSMPQETAARRKLKKTPSIEVFRVFRNPATGAGAEAPALVLTLPPAMAAQHATDGTVHVSDPLGAGDFSKYAGWTAEYTVRTGFSPKKLSAPSNAASVRVYPAANPIEDLKARVTQDAVVLSWTAPQGTVLGPAAPPAEYHIYRMEKPAAGAAAETTRTNENPFAGIEKNTAKATPGFARIGETGTPGFSDAHFQFGASYVYAVRSMTQQDGEQLESADSNLAEVAPRDTFPPTAPQGLVVVYVQRQGGRPAYLDLSWAISTETDLAGYNVYRSDGGRQGGAHGTRVNSQLLPTPSFRDMNAEPGHRYIYSVTAVDRAGNESAPSAAAEGDVPAEGQPSHGDDGRR